MKKFSLLGLFGLMTSLSFADDSWNHRIIEVKSNQELTFPALAETLSPNSIIVLGEKHNTPAIQEAQALVVQKVVEHQRTRDFVLAWEFLNASEQENTEKAFRLFKESALDARGFLKETQGNLVNVSYIPILETVKSLSTLLQIENPIQGVNLSRKEKAPIVEHGLPGADPKIIPPGFSLGGDFYHERFLEALGGHGDPVKIENYFAAQCLTDDVMAFQLLESRQKNLKFLVTGSFHSDYYDGVVARIKLRNPSIPTAVIKFVDASDFTETELVELLNHPRYGAIADFVVFVGEPNFFTPQQSVFEYLFLDW